jgi:hypothetical protein
MAARSSVSTPSKGGRIDSKSSLLACCAAEEELSLDRFDMDLTELDRLSWVSVDEEELCRIAMVLCGNGISLGCFDEGLLFPL